MGWNSYDYYNTEVNETQVHANAEYMASHLKEFGWEYIVIDIEWYAVGAGSQSALYQYIPFGDVMMDNYSRLIPDPARFPSSADGKGFGPLADYIHSLGLKFGIHIMRGIPRAAAHGHTALAGTSLTEWRGTGAVPSGSGYLRFSDNGRYMVSPPMDCLKQKARVRITLEAAGNYKEKASVSIAVFPKEVTQGANKYLITDKPVSTAAAGELDLNVWDTVSQEIFLEKGQRIGFGRADATQACYLSWIKVELIAYE